MWNTTTLRTDADVTFFGLPLSTHRDPSTGLFGYELWIAAIAVGFCRQTLRLNPQERTWYRWSSALLLAFLAYHYQREYALLTTVEIASYAVSAVWFRNPTEETKEKEGTSNSKSSTTAFSSSSSSSLSPSLRNLLLKLAMTLPVLSGSFLLVKFVQSGTLARLWNMLTPTVVAKALEHLFPIREMQRTYHLLHEFTNPETIRQQLAHLLFVTWHIQVGMGFLGIDFLRQEQGRRNMLVRLDVNPAEDATATKTNTATTNGDASTDSRSPASSALEERARNFRRGAPRFILGAALPYMLQIIAYGNVNKYAFSCLEHDMHRQVRLHELFDHENNLIAMATQSATSPEAYANSMNSILSTAYEIWNRKLFSLPKIMLLPAVMSKQPMLVASVFPFIFVSDWVKASLVSYMTTKTEELQKEIQEISAIRSKVESFDMKNAELLQRSGVGATGFTQKRWEDLTLQVQARSVVSDLISRSKGFFAFIQRNFVFSVLVDCALATLIAGQRIVSSDIFVFSRAIEDAVDMLLMRSRSEAELARMETQIDRLTELADLWKRSKAKKQLHCHIASPTCETAIVLRNLHYSRGTASVRADHVEIPAGVYALTGPNGSGKSTLFRVLMSCDTNEKSTDLPSSINMLTPMEPLIEEDDLLRESCCEVDDTEAFLQDDDIVVTEASVDATGTVSYENIDSSKLSEHHVPKLSITLPSSHVVEISQTFYWPLYTKPIEWIYQDYRSDAEEEVMQSRLKRVAQQLHSLQFFQSSVIDEHDAEFTEDPEKLILLTQKRSIAKIMSEISTEKEDWFSDLSGGQKSKVELVRKVFLHDSCPDVLLIDETFAPLDPTSKALVMKKLKEFCKESIVIVIYHTDVGRVDGEAVDCVPSNDFFDRNLHLENGILHIRDTC